MGVVRGKGGRGGLVGGRGSLVGVIRGREREEEVWSVSQGRGGWRGGLVGVVGGR